MIEERVARFGAAYAQHRAAEGRGHQGDELLSLPFLRSGPLARQWAVRARSYAAFRDRVLRPLAADRGGPLTILDLGAGNGWLSYRVALEGHRAVALDIRDDDVDGLGAASEYVARLPDRIERVIAPFEAIPLADASSDLAVFNASLHYAVDLSAVLAEARRVVRPGGRLAILDTPFYVREADGEAMVREKQATAAACFGDKAEALLALSFIEFLTRERLAAASAPLGLRWRRLRLLYPLWYELRPLRAALAGRRPPSRFDCWVSARP
jgi:SAM-dependent methyltransferase